jgi:hypothetical protein
MNWTSRHPVLVWTLAWGAIGLSARIASIFDDNTPGPGWLAFVVGTICWAVAGSTTVHNIGAEITRKRAMIAAGVWASAFIWLASIALPLGEWMRQTRFGSVMPPGFVGMIVAWAIAAALAVAVTSRLVKREPGLVRPVVVAFRWGFAFFFGGYFGVPFASILGQLSEATLSSVLPPSLAYAIGWTAASLFAGLLAATAALTLTGTADHRHDRQMSTT